MTSDCLLPAHASASGALVSSVLPLYSRCINTTCIALAHSEATRPQATTCTDDDANTLHEFGALPGAPAVIPIANWTCISGEDEEEAVTRVHDAIRASTPLVLRGCARAMPAVRRWMSDEHLDLSAGSSLLATRGLDDLNPKLLRDTWWPDSPFAELLWEFSRARGAKSLWASNGGKKAAMHYDSFENLHVVVHGEKLFRLASPTHGEKLYLDFVPHEADEDAEVTCPASGSYGCDGLGCFGYVPFDASRVDLKRYPNVASVPVMEALLKAGDVLLLPAFWLHYIVHLPRDGGGRCIALTFTKQRDLGGRGLGLRPFAAEIAAFHAYAVYKALN